MVSSNLLIIFTELYELLFIGHTELFDDNGKLKKKSNKLSDKIKSKYLLYICYK